MAGEPERAGGSAGCRPSAAAAPLPCQKLSHRETVWPPRKHRPEWCDNSASRRESRPDEIFGKDRLRQTDLSKVWWGKTRSSKLSAACV